MNPIVITADYEVWIGFEIARIKWGWKKVRTPFFLFNHKLERRVPLHRLSSKNWVVIQL